MMKTRVVMPVAILIAVVSYAGNTTVSAKTYYVSASGDDSADGLAEKTAWRTVTHAAKVAAAGDMVKIKAGKYDSEHVIPANSGIKDKPIVFEGYAGTPVLDGKDRKGQGVLLSGREYVVMRNLKLINYMQGIRIQGCKYVTVDKVTLHDMGSAGFSISAKTRHSTISNCTMRNCNMHCLNFMAESSYNLVDNCTFYITTGEKLSADYGIYTENAHHNTIRNSTIKNLHPGVKGHRGHGIALRISSHDNKVINCECYDVLEAFVVGEDGYKNEFTNCRAYADRKTWKKVGHSDGLVARFGAHDNKFINCRSIGCSQGICLWTMHPNPNAKYVTENVQRRNIFRNCIITGAQEFGIVFSRAENNRIENCVFADCAYLSYLNGPTADNSLKNCIITEVKGFSYSRDKKNVKPAITYSCFWKNSFKAPSGKGNISAHPLFVAPAGDDYHLRSQAGRCAWTKAKKMRWVVDITSSACIDTGDPKSEWKNEPKPNGGRVNIGIYGNTPEASKSSK